MHARSSGPTRTQQFSVVLAIELWERFGYYGMQALLLLFLVQHLGFGDSEANLLWGAFAALTYAAPAIGGWLGDRIIGSRRAMVAGAVGLTLGYALLALPSGQRWLLYLGMGAISVGNGLFKPNAANLVRRIFEGDDSRLDAAFTLYYMSVNVGSGVSLLLSPVIAARYGWQAGFAASVAGLLGGLAVFALLRRRLAGVGSAPDARPLRGRTALLVGAGTVVATLAVMQILLHPVLARDTVWLAGIATALILAWLFRTVTAAERPGLLVAVLLIVEVMAFIVFFQQQSTSLTLFALRNVAPDLAIGGTTLMRVAAAQYQSLDAIWIVLFSPVLAWLYGALGRRGIDLPIAVKFVAGFALVTTAFLIYWAATLPGRPPLVSPWIMVASYGFASLGELLVVGLSLAMIARYTPQRLSAFLMGALFVAYGIAYYIGSAVANLAALPPGMADAPPDRTLPLYHGLFQNLLLFGLAVTLVAALLVPVMRRLDRAHHRALETAPVSAA